MNPAAFSRALRLRQRPVRRAPAAEGARAGHHADGVAVELGRVARFPAVRTEREQADAGHEDNGRVRVAQGGRLRRRERLVVGRVVLPVAFRALANRPAQRVEGAGGRVPFHEQGLDPGSHEVVRAAGAHLGQRFGVPGVHELQRFFRIVEDANRVTHRGQPAAQERQDCRRQFMPVAARGDDSAAEWRDCRLVFQDERAEVVDDGRRVEVALPRRRSPGEQAVAGQDDAFRVGMLVDRASQHHRQFESRPLPGQPDELPGEPAVELVEFRPAVGARRQGNGPVGVQMIDVAERQEGVQRRVDGRRHAVVGDAEARVVRHHPVFVRFSLVHLAELQQPPQVEERESGTGHRAEVAAAALHRQHPDRRAGDRVGDFELPAGVAAPVVGDALVGAEQVGSVAKQLDRVVFEGRGFLCVPQIPEEIHAE